MVGIHKFIPLGYRCTSAAILRKLGLKLESYPFDWLISRLDVVRDCIDTGFVHFMNVENYSRSISSTVHFDADGEQRLICEESILYSKYYQPVDCPSPQVTYGYKLALNHRDLTKQVDYDYMLRCIDRFNQLLAEPRLYKISVYIHPVLTNADASIPELINDFSAFHSFLSNKTTKLRGLYFILVRGAKEQPVAIECVHSRENCFVYVIQCNSELVDAGETFLGECTKEVNFISQKIRERVIEDSREFLMNGCQW